MAGMITQLVEIMQDQAQRYEELLGLTLEEKDILIKNEIEELQKITNLKNLVVTQNNRLEKKRIELVNDIAEVMGSNEKDIDLAKLIEIIGGQPEAKDLEEIGRTLRESLQKLKDANELNKQLIESSIDYLEYSINMVRSSVNPEPLEFPDRVNRGEDVYGSFDATQ